MSHTFTTEAEINRYTMAVIKSAISLYLKTGIKANRAYTPSNMLRAASAFTGKPYKRGQLPVALADLITLLS